MIEYLEMFIFTEKELLIYLKRHYKTLTKKTLILQQKNIIFERASRFLRSNIYFNPNGDVELCSRVQHKLSLDLYRRSPKKIFESENVYDVTTLFTEEEVFTRWNLSRNVIETPPRFLFTILKPVLYRRYDKTRDRLM